MSIDETLFLDNVSVRYGTKTVLNNISLHVQRGVFYALTGLNGSGKTTLLKALTRMIPYTGTIYLENKDIKSLPLKEYSKKITLLSQHNTIYAPLTVWEVVLMGRYPYTSLWQGYTQQDADICYQALELTQTQLFKDKKIQYLSGGEAQRVWLAQKIAQNTPVLLLDEPTQHFDLKQKHLFFNLLNDIIQTKQKTILMSTHDLEELPKINGHIWYFANQQVEVIQNYTANDVQHIKERLLA